MTTKTDDVDDVDTGNEEHDDGNEERDGDAELVDQVVARVLEVLNRGDGAGGSDGNDADGATGDEPGAPRTARDEEQSTYHAVRAAMADLRREEASDSRVKKLEARVERIVTETAPTQVRRLTKFLWGDPSK